MPHVKWVPRYIDRPGYPQSRDDYHEVPIITLDDLEDWLRDEFFCMCGRPNEEHTATCAVRIGLRLINQLAQVQAMRGAVIKDSVTPEAAP